jgi:hypothetical protein
MKEAIEEIKTLLGDHEKRISKLEAVVGEPSSEEQKKPGGKKNLSVKEFLKEKKPKGYVQIALAVGSYLEKYEGLSSFNAKDLENGFSEAKEQPPKNFNDTANLNVKNGHMMECKAKKDGKKAWVLTSSGEEFVEDDFSRRNKK